MDDKILVMFRKKHKLSFKLPTAHLPSLMEAFAEHILDESND